MMLVAAAPAGQEQEGPPAIEARVRAVERAEAECRWEELAEQARDLRALLERGEPDWLSASSLLGAALHMLWTAEGREELVEVARDALSSEAEWRARLGGRPLETLGGPWPRVAFELARSRTLLADALHFQGLHAEALEQRRLAIRDLGGMSSRAAGIFLQQSLLAEAGDLMALGRSDEARQRLRALRDGYPRSSQGSVATALLAAPGEPLSSYRGDFLDDPRLEPRARELARALPSARRRVAAWLGRDVEELPDVSIAVADPAQGEEALAAVTQVVPRCPALPPTVVVYAHRLVLGMHDPEALLVHELSHAVLYRELGTRYEELPSWVQESMAWSLAGDLEWAIDAVLSIPLQRDARNFLRLTDLEGLHLELDLSPCFTRSGLGENLAGGLYLEEHCGGPGAPLLALELLAGKPLEEALLAACGQSLAEVVAGARRLARERLEARRQEALPAVREIERLARESPQLFPAMARKLYADEGPLLAREHALRRRAQVLEALGDTAGAAPAWRELLELRGSELETLKRAQVSEVRCLLAGAGAQTAREHLGRLHREALHPEIRAWAADRLAALPPPPSKPAARQDG